MRACLKGIMGKPANLALGALLILSFLEFGVPDEVGIWSNNIYNLHNIDRSICCGSPPRHPWKTILDVKYVGETMRLRGGKAKEGTWRPIDAFLKVCTIQTESRHDPNVKTGSHSISVSLSLINMDWPCIYHVLMTCSCAGRAASSKGCGQQEA